MADPANSKSDAPLMLSVSGLRGLVDRSLTSDVARRYANAVGQWVGRQSAGVDQPLVILGRDSRPSGPQFEQAITQGLAASGCRVTLLGIVTTPSVAVMIDQLGAQGGVVITASHNPDQWNGIKVLDASGAAPPADQAGQIIQLFKAGAQVTSENPGSVDQDDSTHQVHVQRILDLIDTQSIVDRRFKVVLDSVNGAGGPATSILLSRLGVELVHLNAETTGLFPHPPEPTAANLKSLCDAVKEHKADLGLAQDPDADRLAVVDDRGRYIGEEYTLALAADHVLDRHADRGARTLVANLSTSRMIDDIAENHSATVQRTPVGEANVVLAMRQTDAVVGGEGNGGVIWPPVCFVRDSLVGCALVLEKLAATDSSLGELVDQMPAYSMIKHKIALPAGGMESLGPAVSSRFTGQNIDMQDGIRIDWPDRWVHVRPSNTEPILRIIAEAPDHEGAAGLIEQIGQLLDK